MFAQDANRLLIAGFLTIFSVACSDEPPATSPGGTVILHVTGMLRGKSGAV